jgi:hypothetical protein
MKIKFVSGHKAGTIEHLQPSIANTLIAAGLAEHIPYKNYVERLAEEGRASQTAQDPAIVSWGISLGNRNGKDFISARCSRPNCSTLVYDGLPTALESITFCHSCGGGAPEKIPAAVCEQYRSVYRKPVNVGSDEAKCFEAVRALTASDPKIQPFGPKEGVPVDPSRKNYGIDNYKPSPGDNQKADLALSNPVFKKK